MARDLAPARRVGASARAALALFALGCSAAPRGAPLLASAGRRPIEPLAASGERPLYFTGTRTGRPVYLTGSHTWNNFQDWDARETPRAFDYEKYLDFLERHGHNLIRLYVWEQAAWFPGTPEKVVIAPLPYRRTGPGAALDGQPRFDLHQLEPAYFERLRDRVRRAGARGIYVSVMLFDGWSVEAKGEKVGNPWRGHPFNRENNVNGIDGDGNGDGEGPEVHTLRNPAVTALQKEYLAKVVETLRDEENVLFEISNESAAASIDWQYEMIHAIRELESGQRLHHPVGMTAPFPEDARGNAPLDASAAEWISPFVAPARADDPAPASGDKVILSDTDHIFGVGGSPRWVFETLMRGANPLFMDPCVTEIRRNLPAWSASDSAASLPAPCPASEWEPVRLALGYARAVAERVDLARLRPAGELCSTRFCLAAPGVEYLVFAPLAHRRLHQLLGALTPRLAGAAFELDLSAAEGTLDVEWVNAEDGRLLAGDPIAGGGRVELRAPFAADALMHAHRAGHS
ncbi:MAG: DUF6298 domain-containing protein [Myxococcota bacterium]